MDPRLAEQLRRERELHATLVSYVPRAIRADCATRRLSTQSHSTMMRARMTRAARALSTDLLSTVNASDQSSPPLVEWDPKSIDVAGAVVFCDISGFTKLSERFARQGSDGAEKLVTFLNEYFGQLVEIITSFGGDVIKFAGDALLAIFVEDGDGSGQAEPRESATPPESGGESAGSDDGTQDSNEVMMRAMTRQAVACCQVILDVMNNAEDATRPRLHMGVGAGPMHLLQVGGHRNSWEFVVCGEPLYQIGPACSAASPNYCVLSPAAWAYVSDVADGLVLDDGLVRLTAVSFDVSGSTADGVSVTTLSAADNATEASSLVDEVRSDTNSLDSRVTSGTIPYDLPLADEDGDRDHIGEELVGRRRGSSVNVADTSPRTVVDSNPNTSVTSASRSRDSISSDADGDPAPLPRPVYDDGDGYGGGAASPSSRRRSLALSTQTTSLTSLTAFSDTEDSEAGGVGGDIGASGGGGESAAEGSRDDDHDGRDDDEDDDDDVRDAWIKSLKDSDVLTPNVEKALRRFIPSVIQRSLSSESSWVAELRRLAVMFVSVNGMDLTSAACLHPVHNVVKSIQMQVHHYRGVVNKILIDDKGFIVIAGFGLPPASEEDTKNAVLAAIAIQGDLERLGVGTSIGITTGQAFCGIVGSSVRREYTMIGDVVNTAARLMTATASDLLTDLTTATTAGRSVEFEELEARKFKGKSVVTRVFKPKPAQPNQRRVHRVASATAQSDVAAAKSPLLGRLTEVMTMTGALSDLLAGKTRLVIYEGPAGSGKSRLVDEARVQAATRNVAVYSAQGVAVEATTALYAVRSVFAAIFRKASSPRRVRKRVKRLLGSSALPSVPLLETVLPHISFEETFDEANLERGQTRSQALYVLLKDLFKAANKGRPVMLIAEDFQSFDSGSRGLLIAIFKSVPQLFLLITSRSYDGHHTPSTYRYFSSVRGSVVCRLEPLSPLFVRKLAASCLHVEELADDLADIIVEKSGGNPLFIEELCRTLLDSEAVTVANGVLRIGGERSIHDIELPDTMQGLITARLDRLSSSQNQTLKVGAAVGMTFAVRDVVAIHPSGQSSQIDIGADPRAQAPIVLSNAFMGHILADLSVLTSKGFIVLETDGDQAVVGAARTRTGSRFEENLALNGMDINAVYSFSSVFVRDVAYNLMLYRQRTQLHARLALYYERQWGDEVVHVRLLLAHHWNAAGHKRFASLYVEQAAQAALNDALFSSALDLVAEATALLMEGTDADIAFTDDGRLDTDSLPAAISEASDGGGDASSSHLTSGGGSEESLTGATRPLEGERHPDYERFGTHQAICAAAHLGMGHAHESRLHSKNAFRLLGIAWPEAETPIREIVAQLEIHLSRSQAGRTNSGRWAPVDGGRLAPLVERSLFDQSVDMRDMHSPTPTDTSFSGMDVTDTADDLTDVAEWSGGDESVTSSVASPVRPRRRSSSAILVDGVLVVGDHKYDTESGLELSASSSVVTQRRSFLSPPTLSAVDEDGVATDPQAGGLDGQDPPNPRVRQRRSSLGDTSELHQFQDGAQLGHRRATSSVLEGDGGGGGGHRSNAQAFRTHIRKGSTFILSRAGLPMLGGVGSRASGNRTSDRKRTGSSGIHQSAYQRQRLKRKDGKRNSLMPFVSSPDMRTLLAGMESSGAVDHHGGGDGGDGGEGTSAGGGGSRHGSLGASDGSRLDALPGALPPRLIGSHVLKQRNRAISLNVQNHRGTVMVEPLLCLTRHGPPVATSTDDGAGGSGRSEVGASPGGEWRILTAADSQSTRKKRSGSDLSDIYTLRFWYREYFAGREHDLYAGTVDGGPVVIAVRLDSEQVFRVVVHARDSIDNCIISKKDGTRRFGSATKKLLRAIDPNLPYKAFKHVTASDVPAVEAILVDLEYKLSGLTTTVGLAVYRDGVDSAEALLSTEMSVQLAGLLDALADEVMEDGTTVYSKWREKEVTFVVGPRLLETHDMAERTSAVLQRPILVVFCETDASFPLDLVSGHDIKVVVVVRPNQVGESVHYEVGFGVDSAFPMELHSKLVTKRMGIDVFRSYLLTHLMEVAVELERLPAFVSQADKIRRTFLTGAVNKIRK